MPVYHISNFDVSAVQIDLSSNVFADDTLLTHYWVVQEVEFNSNGAIKDDTALNAIFKNVFDVNAEINVVNNPVYYNEGAGGASRVSFEENNFEEFYLNNVLFKDLGVINHDEYSIGILYSSAIYTNVTALRASNNANTSFNGKVKAIFDPIPTITGLRERMMASINASTNSDLSINDAVPEGNIFGFKVVRNLNLAGTSQDRIIHIGILLQQLIV
jgi:hypothetical protein